MTTPPQKVDIAGHQSPFKYKGRDGYFYYTEHAALHTFGINEPGTAQWELVNSFVYPIPKHFIFLSFTPATLENQTMTLDELLALPPETSEQAYRRGYCDGYIVALQEAAGNRPVNAKLWNFWQNNLIDWMKKANSETKMELPPTPATLKG